MKASTNWALTRIVELDEVHPGLAGHFLRSSDERRQVIAAYLAVPRADPILPPIEAELLATANHDDILLAAFGSVPVGFRSALARAGRKTHPRRFYRYLHALLASRHARDVIAILAQQPTLDLDRLRVMRALPSQIRTPRIVAFHRDIDHARQTVSLFRLFIENGVDADCLVQAICASEKPGALGRCWRRAMERLHFPSPPIPACAEYRPIENGGELKATALGFRNCMRRYLTDCLEGNRAFGVLSTPVEEVIVHLRRRDDVWHFEDCNTRGNRSVSPAVEATAADFMLGYGITQFVRKREAATKWEPLRELIARWDFTHDEDVGWG